MKWMMLLVIAAIGLVGVPEKSLNPPPPNEMLPRMWATTIHGDDGQAHGFAMLDINYGMYAVEDATHHIMWCGPLPDEEVGENGDADTSLAVTSEVSAKPHKAPCKH